MQRFAQPEQPRSQHRRILKKSSPCAAHFDLLDFLVLQPACSLKRNGTYLAIHRVEIRLIGKAGRTLARRGPPCSSVSGGTIQIRRTLGRAGANLLEKSWDRPKEKSGKCAGDAEFSSSTARNIPSGVLKRDTPESSPRGLRVKTVAGNSGALQVRKACA